MLKITVVEDQLIQAEKLKKMVINWAEEKGLDYVVSIFNSGENFLFLLEDTEAPDIVLMDIQMGDISGMDAAREMRSRGIKAQLIFITAIRDYVFEGYDVGAVNYLLKPIVQEKLVASLDKIMNNLSGKNEKTILIDRQKVNTTDIFFIEVMGHNLTVHTTGEDITIRMAMNAMYKKLDENGFFRCHKSYVVNIGKIKKIETDSIILDNNTAVPLSRNYRKAIHRKFIVYHKVEM